MAWKIAKGNYSRPPGGLVALGRVQEFTFLDSDTPVGAVGLQRLMVGEIDEYGKALVQSAVAD